MGIRKKVLWRIPVYCIAAGLIVSRLILPMFYPSTLVTHPDNSITVDQPRQLILYGTIFAITLFIGWLLFHRMTRRELFWSATILVVFYLVDEVLIRLVQVWLGPFWASYLYMAETWEWSGFIPTFLYWILESRPVTASGILAPFLFVLFGTGGLKNPVQ